MIARLGSDGGIDTSFGTNGVSVISLDPTTNEIDQQIAAAAIMNDGRVGGVGHTQSRHEYERIGRQ